MAISPIRLPGQEHLRTHPAPFSLPDPPVASSTGTSPGADSASLFTPVLTKRLAAIYRLKPLVEAA